MMSLRPPSLLLKRVLSRPTLTRNWLSTASESKLVPINEDSNVDYDYSFFESELENSLVMHHGKRPRFRNRPKFKSPRKRASKLLDELNKEAVAASIERNKPVLSTPFRVGDAIEIQHVDQGGVHSKQTDKMRGVVLGRVNRGLNSSVYIRDVVFGEPIDRKIHLHSPLLKNLKVLEENFVFKGKKKVKRAKLYYLRNRLPTGTCRSVVFVCSCAMFDRDNFCPD